MYHFATGIIATVLVSGVAFVPTPAESAKDNAERVALEKATAACKVEAKGMKFGWLAEAPEIRPKLHHKVGQPTGHRHLGNPQVGELWEGSAAATRGMGM